MNLCKTYKKELKKLATLNCFDVCKVPRKGEIVPAKIVDVYDGDTVTAVFMCRHNKYYAPFKTAIRINGIDAPEMRDAQQKPAAQIVKKSVSNMLLDRILPVRINKWDKFGGRINADIYLDEACSATISDFLLKRNFVKPYAGKKKQEWTSEELEEILRQELIL